MAKMNTTTLKSLYDNVNLSVAYAVPDCTPKGVVQIVHGMCEHKERYFAFMEYLSANGFICVIHDNRGHGLSVKKPLDIGYMYDGGWKALVEDIEIVRIWLHELWPNLEITLLGHSMGSLAVRSYAKKYDKNIDRLIVCGSPSYRSGIKIGKAISKITETIMGGHYRSKMLQKICLGSFNKPFRKEGNAFSWICSDKLVQEAYRSDPLCNYIFTTNGFRNLMELMIDCYSAPETKAGNIDMPVYFLSGSEDPCLVSTEAHNKSIRLINRSYYTVNSEIIKGMRHEILNETDKKTVWNRILDILAISKEEAFWLN